MNPQDRVFTIASVFKSITALASLVRLPKVAQVIRYDNCVVVIDGRSHKFVASEPLVGQHKLKFTNAPHLAFKFVSIGVAQSIAQNTYGYYKVVVIDAVLKMAYIRYCNMSGHSYVIQDASTNEYISRINPVLLSPEANDAYGISSMSEAEYIAMHTLNYNHTLFLRPAVRIK